jgi:hypothetical protein
MGFVGRKKKLWEKEKKIMGFVEGKNVMGFVGRRKALWVCRKENGKRT